MTQPGIPPGGFIPLAEPARAPGVGVGGFGDLAILQRRIEAARIAQHRPLTDEEMQELTDEPACMHCGGIHARACPRVKRLFWHPNGRIARADYWPHNKINWEGVIWEDQRTPPPETPVQFERHDLDLLTTLLDRAEVELTDDERTAVERLERLL